MKMKRKRKMMRSNVIINSCFMALMESDTLGNDMQCIVRAL